MFRNGLNLLRRRGGRAESARHTAYARVLLTGERAQLAGRSRRLTDGAALRLSRGWKRLLGKEEVVRDFYLQ